MTYATSVQGLLVPEGLILVHMHSPEDYSDFIPLGQLIAKSPGKSIHPPIRPSIHIFVSRPGSNVLIIFVHAVNDSGLRPIAQTLHFGM